MDDIVDIQDAWLNSRRRSNSSSEGLGDVECGIVPTIEALKEMNLEPV